MRFNRYIIPLFLILTVIALVTTPLAEGLLTRLLQKDVEQRITLIFQSLEDPLAELAAQKDHTKPLQRLFNNIARDEHILSVGLCGPKGKLLVSSREWPEGFSCPPYRTEEQSSFTLQKLPNKWKILYGRFLVPVKGEKSLNFVVLHDMSFVSQREGDMRFALIFFLTLFSFATGLITLWTTRLMLRRWLKRLQIVFTKPNTKFADQKLPREFMPLVREIRQLVKEVDSEIDSIKVKWTPQTLETLLADDLPNTEVIVVSNREPYIHERQEDGSIKVTCPAGGVVSALEPVVRACKGAWIAHGNGSADKDVVDSKDNFAAPPENPCYVLHRVWLDDEEVEGYYNGFSNEGIWPLCHITFVRPIFRARDWEIYKKVNKKFAEAVIKTAKTENPVILIQDYHLAMAAKYIRQKMPKATIVTFWHIPWPNAEMFSICPWREELLEGLLANSILGFHTRSFCRNFMEGIERFMEAQCDRERNVVTINNHPTLVRSYPISIAWPPNGLDQVPSPEICRETIRARFNLPKDIRIGTGFERLDYTKGIIDRFLAIREFLQAYPEWIGKFTFIQVAAPTRAEIPAYQEVRRETEKLAEEINQEFGNKIVKPIILLQKQHTQQDAFELFRASDLCIVSSLHDGMNLVAKEFVAARDDEQGVLLLSSFTGASKELSEAILVNPYDPYGMGQAIAQALHATKEEQREGMRFMREKIEDNNVFFWAARILLDVSHLRKKERIEDFLKKEM